MDTDSHDEDKLVAALMRGIRACQTRDDVMSFARQPESTRTYARLSEDNKTKIKKAMRARADALDNPPNILNAG